MAIEANMRKRKHKDDDGTLNDEVVPKKMAKKMKKKKTAKHENQHQVEQNNDDTILQVAEGEELSEELSASIEDNNQDSGIDPGEEKYIKFSKDFKMLNFRAKLRGNDFIKELRHLLHLAQSSSKIIAKYIEKRGKPLELAEAFERIDKSNIGNVAYLCQALQLVVMEILTNQKPHLESALHACRYFLKAHSNVIDALLQSANLQHRRVALKLLTAIVCVDPQLGRQLLSSYNILSNVRTIENFLSHSKFELDAEDTVRKCYIHFVLAYLVDGNTLLIRNILDCGTVIRALVSGLLYDDHVTVCVVLGTLKKYVLECAEISKTKKIHVFDLECCKHLVRLYDWHGPKVYAAKFANKNGAEFKLQPNIIRTMVDAEALEAVSSSLHEFLLVLLTSRKYGITFDAITHFRQKHNALQGKLIGFLFKPWCDQRKTDLIVKILIACPDLARHTIRNFAGIVNPMLTAKTAMVDAFNFLQQLISTLHPSLLKNAIDKITLTDFSHWIKDICLPLEVLVHITGSNVLRNNDYNFRMAANRLLLTMFTQYANYVAVINKRELAKGGNSLRRFKFDILNHILVNFPTVESILYSLYRTIQQKNDIISDENVLDHLEVTLDLVLIICKENRSFVNKTGTILSYLDLLRPLYASDSDDEHNEGNINLELKAIKTILLLFPKALEPHENLFRSVLKSLIKAYVRGSNQLQRESGDLLHSIFKNTGLFDAGELEIDLWLEALRFFDASTVDMVTNVFIEVLQVTKAEVDAPKTADATNTNETNLQKLFANIEQGLSAQVYIETLAVSKLLPLIYKGVEIVQPLDKYLETVCLLMFHYYPTPENVQQLYGMHFKSLKKYMSSWLQLDVTNELRLEGKIAAIVPYLSELQAIILEGNGTKFEELFAAATTGAAAAAEDNSVLEIDYNGKMQKFNGILSNERMILIYTQAILFIVAQLVAKAKLSQQQATQAASFLKSFINIAQQLAIVRTKDQREVLDDGSISFVGQLLKYIYNTRIIYIGSAAEIFNTEHACNMHYLQFLAQLTESCSDIESFADCTANYRLRIVAAAAICMQQPEQTMQQSNDQFSTSLRLVQAFHLNASNCIEILKLIGAKLNYKHFFITATAQKTIFYELTVLLLQRLASLQVAVECESFVSKFAKIYINLVHKTSADINLEQLEDAFAAFLLVSHHYITQLDAKFFSACLEARKVTKSTVKLAALLLERDAKLTMHFVQLLPAQLGKKELIYPLLKIVFQKQPQPCIDTALLNSIYQSYKSGFMKTIEKPQKAGVIYKEHVEASLALIAHCMPRSECVDFCNKNFKFDTIELYQMQLINAIYKKALDSTLAEESSGKQRQHIFVNYLSVQIQMLVVDIKKQTLDAEKIAHFAFNIQQWLLNAPKTMPENSEDATHDFSKIIKSKQWLDFCKIALKFGMQVPDESIESVENVTALQKAQSQNALLLELLAYLCDYLYANYAEETAAASSSEEPAQLYHMIFTHSKFNDIILSQHGNNAPSPIKTQVLHLLYVLAQKSPMQSLSAEQLPIILGAYQARLYAADRWTLALLQLYERWPGANGGVQRYRPFIWGESAIAFYELRAADDATRANLTQTETSIAQVMSLIDRQVCEYTIDNFPIWRKLQATQQLPDTCFADPAQRACTFGANPLERRIENGAVLKQPFSIPEMRLCPKREAVYAPCYDPAFFVPLMSACFADGSYSHPARPVQNGLLALVFTTLSSQDADMRLAAGCAQLRYRAHFESSKFFERPLWLQVYENIQSGLNDLRDSWLKHKRNSGTPRVPFISALFIAKSFNLTTDPTHLLYKQLTMYLRLKSSFNFQCVPEFNILFYSPEVEHHAFRRFIVEIIRDGIKSSTELYLLTSTHTLKVLMGFYGSSMSTLDLNLLILSVFSTCVKIPASSKIMIDQVGLLPWLATIIGSLEFYHFDIIEGLISILNNLWYAVKANAAEFHNYSHICTALHRLLLLLLPHMSARIPVGSFAKLLNILLKTVLQPEQYLAMSAAQLDHLIDCAQRHFPAQVHTLAAVRTFGGNGAEETPLYCQRLHALQVDSIAILALSSLRSYIIGWWPVACQRVGAIAAPETEVVAV